MKIMYKGIGRIGRGEGMGGQGRGGRDWGDTPFPLNPPQAFNLALTLAVVTDSQTPARFH